MSQRSHPAKSPAKSPAKAPSKSPAKAKSSSSALPLKNELLTKYDPIRILCRPSLLATIGKKGCTPTRASFMSSPSKNANPEIVTIKEEPSPMEVEGQKQMVEPVPGTSTASTSSSSQPIIVSRKRRNELPFMYPKIDLQSTKDKESKQAKYDPKEKKISAKDVRLMLAAISVDKEKEKSGSEAKMRLEKHTKTNTDAAQNYIKKLKLKNKTASVNKPAWKYWKKNAVVSEKKVAALPVKKDAAVSVKKDAAAPVKSDVAVKKDVTVPVKKVAAIPVKKDPAVAVKKDVAVPLKKVPAVLSKKVTFVPLKKVPVVPLKKDATVSVKKHVAVSAKKEAVVSVKNDVAVSVSAKKDPNATVSVKKDATAAVPSTKDAAAVASLKTKASVPVKDGATPAKRRKITVNITSNPSSDPNAEATNQSVKRGGLVPLPTNPIIGHTVKLLRHKRALQKRLELLENDNIVIRIDNMPKLEDHIPKGKVIVQNPPLSEQEANDIVINRLASLISHGGYTRAHQQPVEILGEVVKSFFTNMAHRLKEVRETEMAGAEQEFPDPLERVLVEEGLGGVRGLEKFYNSKVVDYQKRLEEKCIYLRRLYGHKIKQKVGMSASSSGGNTSSSSSAPSSARILSPGSSVLTEILSGLEPPMGSWYQFEPLEERVKFRHPAPVRHSHGQTKPLMSPPTDRRIPGPAMVSPKSSHHLPSTHSKPKHHPQHQQPQPSPTKQKTRQTSGSSHSSTSSSSRPSSVNQDPPPKKVLQPSSKDSRPPVQQLQKTHTKQTPQNPQQQIVSKSPTAPSLKPSTSQIISKTPTVPTARSSTSHPSIRMDATQFVKPSTKPTSTLTARPTQPSSTSLNKSSSTSLHKSSSTSLNKSSTSSKSTSSSTVVSLPNSMVSINLNNNVDLGGFVPITSPGASRTSKLNINKGIITCGSGDSKAKLKEALSQRNLLRLNFEQVPSNCDSTVLLSSSSPNLSSKSTSSKNPPKSVSQTTRLKL